MDIVAAFDRCARDHRGLATRAQLAAAGIGRGRLQQALASKDLVRVARAVYGRRALAPWAQYLLSGGVVDEAFARHAQAMLLRIGPGSALCGRSAALVWGLDMLVEPETFELQVPRGLSHVARLGCEVRRTRYPVVVVRGLSVTSLDATLLECARSRPLNEAVAMVDSALRRKMSVSRPSGRGRLARAVQLADPRSGSVLESALRVLLAEAGLPPPKTQHVVRDGQKFVARVDFCWPDVRLIVEADGRRWHDPQDARLFDRRRANSCAALGWRLLRFTWAEVMHEPDYVVATVRAALASR